MKNNTEEPRNQDFPEEVLTSNKDVVCRRVSVQNLLETLQKFRHISRVVERANMDNPLENQKCTWEINNRSKKKKVYPGVSPRYFVFSLRKPGLSHRLHRVSSENWPLLPQIFDYCKLTKFVRRNFRFKGEVSFQNVLLSEILICSQTARGNALSFNVSARNSEAADKSFIGFQLFFICNLYDIRASCLVRERMLSHQPDKHLQSSAIQKPRTVAHLKKKKSKSSLLLKIAFLCNSGRLGWEGKNVLV